MENKFNKIYPYSFTSELDFMFAGEYLNGTFLFEFNPETHECSYVKDVKKNDLIRFGVVGHGLRAYFNALNGVFSFDNDEIEIIYKTKYKEYNLTDNVNTKYNDIIYFKNAFSENNGYCHFVGYNFGYKNHITFDDGVSFYFKPIINIPLNQPANIQIHLVSNLSLDGEIIIKVNKLKSYNMYAPLEKNVGGDLTWLIRR